MMLQRGCGSAGAVRGGHRGIVRKKDLDPLERRAKEDGDLNVRVFGNAGRLRKHSLTRLPRTRGRGLPRPLRRQVVHDPLDARQRLGRRLVLVPERHEHSLAERPVMRDVVGDVAAEPAERVGGQLELVLRRVREEVDLAEEAQHRRKGMSAGFGRQQEAVQKQGGAQRSCRWRGR